jgi:hypothetical protein
MFAHTQHHSTLSSQSRYPSQQDINHQVQNRIAQTSSPSTTLSKPPRKFTLKADWKIALAALTPATTLILELRYKPVVAIAICSFSTPAVKPTKTAELAIPDAQPPKKITNEPAVLVWPRQKVKRREKQRIADRLARMVGGL